MKLFEAFEYSKDTEHLTVYEIANTFSHKVTFDELSIALANILMIFSNVKELTWKCLKDSDFSYGTAITICTNGIRIVIHDVKKSEESYAGYEVSIETSYCDKIEKTYYPTYTDVAIAIDSFIEELAFEGLKKIMK